MSQSALPGVGHDLARELVAFAMAVFAGSLGGLLAGHVFSSWTDATTAGAGALAVGTTITGAAHARLIHGQTVRSLVPRVLVAAPLAYVVMYGAHRLIAP